MAPDKVSGRTDAPCARPALAGLRGFPAESRQVVLANCLAAAVHGGGIRVAGPPG
jgi:hypothetical protein